MAKITPAAEIFLREFELKIPNPSLELKEFSSELAENHLVDLQPTSGHFTPETQDLLSLEAARRWSEIALETKSRDEMARRWSEVVRDFHSHARWNFPVVAKRVKRKKKKNIAVSMLWTAFSSFVLTKCLVLYFGGREMSEPSLVNNILLLLAVGSSFAGLFYFTYKHGKAMHEEEARHSESKRPASDEAGTI